MRTLILTFSISLLWTANVFSQPTYTSEQISTEKELNLAFTDKRGIKGDDGTVYFIEKDNQTLTAYSDNKIKWAVNIIKVCKEPTIGKPEIRYLKLSGTTIQITFGKHDHASVNIHDGKAKYLGAD